MDSLPQSLLDLTLQQLLQTQKDCSPNTVERISGPPSRLKLTESRSQNFPAIFTDATSHFRAHAQWNSEYFRKVMGEDQVTVAMTPNGLADSIIGEYFVQPFQRGCKMEEMLDWLKTPDHDIRYLQLQNGSLNLEFQALKGDVDAAGPEWANDVFGDDCLTNIWIGNHMSTTSLHHDPYENIYCQILGCKKFTLFPPQEYHMMQEKRYVGAHYALEDGRFVLRKDEPENTVPWLTLPASRIGLEVILQPGETLYLPALWFHQVEQIDNDEGMCVAVNYWWDLDYAGTLWMNWKFMRKVSLVAQGRLEECKRELQEEEDL